MTPYKTPDWRTDRQKTCKVTCIKCDGGQILKGPGIRLPQLPGNATTSRSDWLEWLAHECDSYLSKRGILPNNQ